MYNITQSVLYLMGSQLCSCGLLGLDQQLFTRKLLVACVAMCCHGNCLSDKAAEDLCTQAWPELCHLLCLAYWCSSTPLLTVSGSSALCEKTRQFLKSQAAIGISHKASVVPCSVNSVVSVLKFCNLIAGEFTFQRVYDNGCLLMKKRSELNTCFALVLMSATAALMSTSS